MSLIFTHFMEGEIKVPMVKVKKTQIEMPSIVFCPGTKLIDNIDTEDFEVKVMATEFKDTDDITQIVQPGSGYEWREIDPETDWVVDYSIYRKGCFVLDFSKKVEPPQIKFSPHETDVIRVDFKTTTINNFNISSIPEARRSVHIGLFDSKDTSKAPSVWQHTYFGTKIMGQVKREDVQWMRTPFDWKEMHYWTYPITAKTMGPGHELELNLWLFFPDDSFLITQSTSFQTTWSPSALLVLAGLLSMVANLSNLFNFCFPYDTPRRIGAPMMILTLGFLKDRTQPNPPDIPYVSHSGYGTTENC